MKFPDDLLRGDICLYRSKDITDEVIIWKEGDDVLSVAHIEIYAGGGQSWASRNGIGVGLYPFRPDGLVIVRRPSWVFDPQGKIDAWFATVKGTEYGWADIAANAGIVISNAKGEDCSHFAAVLMETAGCPQFDLVFPRNEITPRDFKLSLMSAQMFPAPGYQTKPNPYTAVAS